MIIDLSLSELATFEPIETPYQVVSTIGMRNNSPFSILSSPKDPFSIILITMVILLDGASAMARASIAEQVSQLMPAWKHLAMEVIAETTPENEGNIVQHVELVKRCAEELGKDDLHLILSMPAAPEHLILLRTELAPYCVAVHLGEGDEDGYDFAFDASVTSVKDIVAFLEKLIAKLPDIA